MKAFAYVKTNNLEKAHESIVKANKLMPNSLDISLDYSNILNSLGRKEEAFNILKKLNGRKHNLVSSVCISKKGNMIWNHTDKAELFMKNLKDDELKNYLSVNTKA